MKYLLCCLLVIMGMQASGQDRTIPIRPRPAWVKVYPYPEVVKDTANLSDGYFNLLSDDQYNLDSKESYHHYAQKVITEKGLENISTISNSFDPAYQSLIFHSIEIVRNGKKINQFSIGSFQILQREENLERLLYDGNLTAVFNIQDLHVGDILDYSYTIKGRNPLFKDKYSGICYLNFSVPINLVVCRFLAKDDQHFEVKRFNNAPGPRITNTNGVNDYEWVLTEVPALLSEDGTPGWFDPYDHIQISNFGSWADLSAWATDIFKVNDKKVSLLQKIPELQTGDKEESIGKAIRFVQDEIRYLSFSEGIHGYKPHAPHEVLKQRFGDCKDKSVLLSELLNEMGIASSPVLINTGYGKALPDYLPSPSLFNHCVVEFTLKDSVYWIDPTYTFQRGPLKRLYFPRYHNGLVVNSSSKQLTEIPQLRKGSISMQENFLLDKVGGKATLNVKTIYSDQEADNIRDYFNSNSLTEIEKQYINFYATDYPNVTKGQSFKWTDDAGRNVIISEESYEIVNFWNYDSLKKEYSASTYPRNLASYLVKPTTKIRQFPYSISHPLSISHKIVMTMPEEWNVVTATKTVQSPGFVYRSNLSYSDKVITLLYQYESKKAFMEASEVKDHIARIDEALNDLTFTLTHGGNSSANKAFNLPFLLILLITLGGAGFVMKWIYNLDPDPRASNESHDSIGGWLVLPAIGLCISPFVYVWELASLDYFEYSNWRVLSDPTYSAYSPALGGFVLIEMMVNFTMMVFSVFLVFLFFMRRTTVPYLATFFYAFSCVYLITDAWVGTSFGSELDDDTAKTLFRSILAAAIWIPYFLISDRSKGTFTVRRRPAKGVTNDVVSYEQR